MIENIPPKGVISRILFVYLPCHSEFCYTSFCSTKFGKNPRRQGSEHHPVDQELTKASTRSTAETKKI